VMIAHLPAGYLLTVGLLSTTGLDRQAGARTLLVIGLVASVAPDVDGLVWAGVKAMGRPAPHHHDFPTHWPLAWLLLVLLIAAVALVLKRKSVLSAAGVVGLNLGLHGLLDSVASPMTWGAPFSDAKWEMVRVPPMHGDKWVLSMLDHWTFGLEVVLVVMAGCLLIWRRRRQRSRSA
jgi:membrane-bound metal-dependent hydrolase YbcI (DUF457 family)